MKKILLSIFLAGITSLSFAQSVKINVDAGLNESTFPSYSAVFYGNVTQTVNYTNHTGFYAGASAEFSIKRFSIVPGLMYVNKGSNYSYTAIQSEGNITNITSASGQQIINYVEIPLNFLYNVPLKKLGKLFVGAGGYTAFALSGHGTTVGNNSNHNSTTGTTINTPINSSSTTSFGSDPTQDKKQDYGIDALVGIKLNNNISIKVGYDLGLTNIYNGGGSPNLTNRTLRFGVGYSFL